MSLLAELDDRRPTGKPEAEVSFGDHPGDPSETADGRTFDQWISDDGHCVACAEKLGR